MNGDSLIATEQRNIKESDLQSTHASHFKKTAVLHVRNCMSVVGSVINIYLTLTMTLSSIGISLL